MTSVNSQIDLAGLTRTHNEVVRPRRSVARIVVPSLLLLGLAAVLWYTLGETFARKITVTLVRPEPVTDGVMTAASAGTTLYQAAGWVEPEPFAITVPALVAGTVKKVNVLESAVVLEGDVVAELVSEAEVLALKEAEAKLAAAEAEAKKDRAVLKVAESRFSAAAEVKERMASARAEFDAKSSTLREKTAAASRANVAIQLAKQELELVQHLASVGAAGTRQVQIAEAKLREVGLAEDEARAAIDSARGDLNKARAMLAKAESDMTLRSDDRKDLEEARGEFESHEASAREAAAVRDLAALALDRTLVRSPTSGVVLSRLVMPGSSLAEAGAPVMTLYDPTSMRIRVDVAQGDVGRARVGQRAEILADVRPGNPYRGEVRRIVHQADLAKVTLQVHVAVLDADNLLRPDMLTQVRFYESVGAATRSSTPTITDAVSVPIETVIDGGVWVLDAESLRAKHVKVKTRPGPPGRIIVTDGIDLSSKVVLSAEGGMSLLQPGMRLNVDRR